MPLTKVGASIPLGPVGTRFFIGYGTSSDELLASGRIRLVYEVGAAVTKLAK